jgi:hypothetical protein
MIQDKVMDILKHEVVVAIATQGKKGPQLINTRHSCVQIDETRHLFITV